MCEPHRREPGIARYRPSRLLCAALTRRRHRACLQHYYTPLHSATVHGKLDIVTLLLDRGAAVEAKDIVRMPYEPLLLRAAHPPRRWARGRFTSLHAKVVSMLPRC